MRYITFPLLIPTILTLLLLNIGSFLTLGFDQVYNLYTPMTYAVADIFDTYVFRVGIQQAQYSFATAVGLFQSVVGLIMVVTFNKIANKVSDDERSAVMKVRKKNTSHVRRNLQKTKLSAESLQ